MAINLLRVSALLMMLGACSRDDTGANANNTIANTPSAADWGGSLGGSGGNSAVDNINEDGAGSSTTGVGGGAPDSRGIAATNITDGSAGRGSGNVTAGTGQRGLPASDAPNRR
jgi:hypothetical protein